MNQIIIWLNHALVGAERVWALADEVVAVLVEAWQPDCCAVTSRAHRRAQRRGRRVPAVGAVSWFADHLGPVPAVLPEARVRRLGSGTLVDLRVGSHPPPVEVVSEVAAWLDRTGVRADLPLVQPVSAAATPSHTGTR